MTQPARPAGPGDWVDAAAARLAAKPALRLTRRSFLGFVRNMDPSCFQIRVVHEDRDAKADGEEAILYAVNMELIRQHEQEQTSNEPDTTSRLDLYSANLVHCFATLYGDYIGEVMCHSAEAQMMMHRAHYAWDVPDASGSDTDDGDEGSNLEKTMETSEVQEVKQLQAALTVVKGIHDRFENDLSKRKQGGQKPTLAAGGLAIINGLVSRPDLNGKMALVMRKQADSGRWVIQPVTAIEGGPSTPVDGPNTLHKMDVRPFGKQLAVLPKNLIIENLSETQAQQGKTSDAIAVQWSIDRKTDIIAALLPTMKLFNRPKPSSAWKQIFKKVVAELGWAKAFILVTKIMPGSKVCAEPDEVRGEVQLLQMFSAKLAFLFEDREHKSPDCVGLHGVAQFLKGNLLEAVKDLRAAVTLAKVAGGTEWILSPEPTAESLVQMLLTQARAGMDPLLGSWRKLKYNWTPTADSADTVLPCVHSFATAMHRSARSPCERQAAATCQIGSLLFVFGGMRAGLQGGGHTYLRPTLSMFRDIARDDLSAGQQCDIPLNDLRMMDLQSKSWYHTGPTASTALPSPRAYAIMAHDSRTTDKLFLFGGRATYHVKSRSVLTDMWKCSVRDGQWSQVKGKHPHIAHLGPHTTYNGGWFILNSAGPHQAKGYGRMSGNAAGDADLPAVQLLRFDLDKAVWSSAGHQKTAPALADSTCGWQDGATLFVWGTERVPRLGMSIVGCALWAVDLAGTDNCMVEGKEDGKWGRWTPYVIIDNSLEDPRQDRCLQGHRGVSWAEGAACFDPITKKAYIFGGWNSDMYGHSVLKETGTVVTLEGRYYGILVEIDMITSTMRTLESVSATGRETLGPGRRAEVVIGAWTGPDSLENIDTEQPVKSRVVVGFGYSTFSLDTGEFGSVSSKHDIWQCTLLSEGCSGGSTAGDAASDAVEQPFESGLTLKSYSADELCDLQCTFLQDDVNVRKLMTERCHVGLGSGAFVGDLMTSECAHVDPSDFWTESNLPWLSAEQIFARFPNMKEQCIESYSCITETNPASHFAVLFVFFDKRTMKLPQEMVGSVDRPYGLRNAHFARFTEGHGYINTVITCTGSGERHVAARARSTSPPGTCRPMDVDICTNVNCPKRYVGLGLQGNSTKLKVCGGCSLVQYCCTKCQKEDWKSHRQLCKKLST